eukprot:Rhum_TRINITY_DN15268_c4_g2::Rhum_TRINITY_DN15268_c4_g2_i5::g.147583::m.147583
MLRTLAVSANARWKAVGDAQQTDRNYSTLASPLRAQRPGADARLSTPALKSRTRAAAAARLNNARCSSGALPLSISRAASTSPSHTNTLPALLYASHSSANDNSYIHSVPSLLASPVASQRDTTSCTTPATPLYESSCPVVLKTKWSSSTRVGCTHATSTAAPCEHSRRCPSIPAPSAMFRHTVASDPTMQCRRSSGTPNTPTCTLPVTNAPLSSHSPCDVSRHSAAAVCAAIDGWLAHGTVALYDRLTTSPQKWSTTPLRNTASFNTCSSTWLCDGGNAASVTAGSEGCRRSSDTRFAAS